MEKFDIAVVFGSGHRAIADSIENPQIVHYAEIPHFPIPTNIGHGSELVYGDLFGKKALLFKGRIHPLEGYRSFYHSWIGYLVAMLGCELLVSTNSCGAIIPSLQVGDVMIMSDHINCSGLPLLNAGLIDDKLRKDGTYLRQGSFAH